MKFYLAFNALCYAALAVWCTLAHERASVASGYASLNASGRSEYLAIYGGLQAGLALFFAYLATRPELHREGVRFALMLYAPIVVYRWVTLIRFGPVSAVTWGTGLLETGLLLAAAALWFAKTA